jgi:hypothetical protein
MSAASLAIAKGAVLLTRLFGVGGGAWDVLTPTGDGITADRIYVLSGTWNGFIAENQVAREAAAAAGVPAAGDKRWEAISRNAIPQPGTILRSVATPAIAFLIVAPDIVPDYYRAIVRPATAINPTTSLLDLQTTSGVTVALGMDVL